MISFEETFSPGTGQYIKVNLITKIDVYHERYRRLISKPVTITIGRIAPHYGGKLYYFEPETNVRNPTFIEDSLEKLKEKIRAYKEKEASHPSN